MVRKIGKINLFLWLWSSFFYCTDAQISLFVSDLQGESFDYIGSQQPFFLHVNIRNINIDRYPDTIPGAETCIVSHARSLHSTSVTNGILDEMVSHKYMIRAKKEGQFVFGPIELVDKNGQKVVSNSVKVTISDTPLVHTSKIKPFFLTFSVDRSKIYLGQKIIVTTRFYYRSQHDHLEIAEPSYSGCFILSRSQQYKHGQEVIDGNEFLYKEVQTELFPEAIGVLDILPARALYTDGSGQRNFFGMQSFQKKELISKFLSIDVLPLPKHSDGENVVAVGQFFALCLHVESHKHEVGKAVIAQYIIKGEGNFELIPLPQIEMPQFIRSYSSTYKIQNIADGKREKIFEIVIQGSNPGVFKIPKQRFVFFDPEVKKYKTIYSEPFELTFTGDAIEIKPEKKEVKDSKFVENVENKYTFQDWQIDQIYQGREIKFNGGPIINPDLFLKLLIGLFLILVFLLVYLYAQKIMSLLLKKYILIQEMFVFSILFLMNKDRKKTKSTKQLYDVLGLFFNWHGFDIHDDYGKIFLEKIECTNDEQDEWVRYMNQLYYVMYANKHDEVSTQSLQDLHTQAIAMFKLFFKKIKKMRNKVK